MGSAEFFGLAVLAEDCNITMQFDWDENKARLNLTKHDISFDEAKTIFDDPLYVDFFDPDHSDSENRYLRFGMSNQHRLLLVSYTERGDTQNN